MHIALIYYRMMLRPGGLESRLHNYLREFTRLGHEVTLLMARPRNLSLPEGVRLQRLPRGPFPKSLQPLGFNAALGGWMRRNAYDLSLSLERTSHQDAVLNPGNHLGFLRAENRPPGTVSDWVQIRLDRLAFRESRVVLAASPMMQEETVELYGVNPQKIALLPPPVDTARFCPAKPAARDAWRASLGIRPDEIACAFVSSSHQRKGIGTLIEVFKALKDKPFRLVVAGSPPPPEAAGLEKMIWLGHSQQPEAIFGGCDLSLLPARYEPFGQVVSESVLCGCPAFVSDRVGAGAYLGAHEGVVLPFDKPEAWIAALEAFQPGDFRPGPDFARRHSLGLDQHMNRLISLIKS